MRGRKNTPDAFWVLVEKQTEDGCWEWRGATLRNGYGQWQMAGRFVYPHRYAWELNHGAIPAGKMYVVTHLCGNRLCVRPEHMELVSKRDGNRRSLGNTPDAFWARVRKLGDDDCWLWEGTVGGRGGYGVLQMQGRQVYAHRYAWEISRGEVPEGLQLDHLCRNRLCVNPAHLEPVTAGENVRRGLTAYASGLRTTCRNGHPLIPENRERSRDECKACRLEWYARNRQAERERMLKYYYARKASTP